MLILICFIGFCYNFFDLSVCNMSDCDFWISFISKHFKKTSWIILEKKRNYIIVNITSTIFSLILPSSKSFLILNHDKNLASKIYPFILKVFFFNISDIVYKIIIIIFFLLFQNILQLSETSVYIEKNKLKDWRKNEY